MLRSSFPFLGHSSEGVWKNLTHNLTLMTTRPHIVCSDFQTIISLLSSTARGGIQSNSFKYEDCFHLKSKLLQPSIC